MTLTTVITGVVAKLVTNCDQRKFLVITNKSYNDTDTKLVTRSSFFLPESLGTTPETPIHSNTP